MNSWGKEPSALIKVAAVAPSLIRRIIYFFLFAAAGVDSPRSRLKEQKSRVPHGFCAALDVSTEPRSNRYCTFRVLAPGWSRMPFLGQFFFLFLSFESLYEALFSQAFIFQDLIWGSFFQLNEMREKGRIFWVRNWDFYRVYVEQQLMLSQPTCIGRFSNKNRLKISVPNGLMFRQSFTNFSR